ncbi:MAG TPA: methylmalonyl Co-A mutase-associated GTPase MeaB [Chloroflexi bacterium]|nr:methylmalonyl Co-A mutase-associated GTPase MeaB [Chloroflexota bacterium]
MGLVDAIRGGDRRALARLITEIENNAAGASEALAALFSYTGQAHLIGVTGAPGTGKSSLVNRLALALRERGRTVGIVAVDPTSPFSGGALLGDRIRMRDLAGDPGVFIRSMATRGSLGGLARATSDVVKALDAAGFEVILIETVGAGQAEVDIARQAHTIIVVEAPGLGDDVQAIKAGILEIADILVVNKADDPRAGNTVRALRGMLELAGATGDHRSLHPYLAAHHGRLLELVRPSEPAPTDDGTGWSVPIQTTIALSGEGVPELLEAIDAHRAYLLESGEIHRRERLRVIADLDNLLREALLNRLLEQVDNERLGELVERIMAREILPQEAVRALLDARP